MRGRPGRSGSVPVRGLQQYVDGRVEEPLPAVPPGSLLICWLASPVNIAVHRSISWREPAPAAMQHLAERVASTDCARR